MKKPIYLSRQITASRHGGGYTIMKKALPVFVVLALLASGCKVDVSDSTPPANPSKVKAYGGMSSVRLSWTNPDDSDFYAVEITASALGETQSTIAIPGKPSEKKSFNFTGLTNGKEYTFVMRSVDTVTNRSSGTTITCYAQSNASIPSDTESSDSEEHPETQESIIKTEKQTVTFTNSKANFTMIDISFTDGRTEDSIILGEDLLEVPYPTTVKPFRLAMYETSYNTWYEVLKWAESNGYTIANKGSEGQYGGIGSETNMNPDGEGAEPKLVEMPVTSLTWRDAMVWCNALSEMKNLKPVYYTDASFEIPIRNSTGPSSTKLEDYLIKPGQVDNPYVNTNANGFRLPYVKEWEYAARKRTDATAISGRNVSGDDTGAMFSPTPIEQMNGIDYPISTSYGKYIWWRKTSSGGVSKTASGLDDTTATLQKLTGNSAIGSYRTHLSGGKLPNHLGFYDMSGNVPEWCFDYNVTYGSTNKFHTMRTFRGGDQVNESYSGNPTHCSGNKGGQIVGIKGGGFRIAQNH